MSLRKTATPSGVSARMVLITFWKQLGVELSPNGILVYRNTPACITKAVMRSLLAGWSGTCRYPWRRSSLVNTVEPWKSAVSSSDVGRGYLSGITALFAWWRSMQIRIPP